MEWEIFACKECNKGFNSNEALSMHNSAKHSRNISGEKTAKSDFKKIKNWIILALILSVVFYGIFRMFSNAGYSDVPASEINIGSHQNIALHIHSDLSIFINGEEFFIPANIGIGSDYMRPLHTHDSSGEIHIEGPYARDFTLGEFFGVWDKVFNSSCILDYCAENEKAGELKMYVNSRESFEFENHVLKDGNEIKIEYKSK
ncbi:MAG TPA: hypothetical protein VJ208_03350 [Candidatus Nanoarchaeia archaeon]|nr:hypothetical protein [Candidatus Nanoarchaeia archaeon]